MTKCIHLTKPCPPYFTSLVCGALKIDPMTKLSKGLTGSRSLLRWVFRISHTNASGSRESQEETLEFHGIPGSKIDAPLFILQIWTPWYRKPGLGGNQLTTLSYPQHTRLWTQNSPDNIHSTRERRAVNQYLRSQYICSGGAVGCV